MKIEFSEIEISVYQHLRKACGLSNKSDEAASIGLSNSLTAVLCKDSEKPIGMGRVIGDGGCFCQVVDICILPEYQGRGLGKQIMEKLIEYIQTLPNTCYISLIADGEAHRLYTKYGFKNVQPDAKGMYLKINK